MSDIEPKSERTPLLVRLDERERQKLERIARAWGVPLAVAVRRLILEKRVREQEDTP
ncbi:hypothetical protein [Deinococcus aluminii]|uniref:Ribbon-helix-helix protein CopG domain-containing protein n=1 Tax=Deinococcus aluminii TaxID=1656885 RepID=A0ABP9XH58_9DEIO